VVVVKDQASPPPPPTRTTFPDPLKKYVARTFEDVSQEDRKDVEAELKRIITDAFNQKVVWTVDWDTMPLPQTVLAKKRAQMKQERSSASATTSTGGGDTSPTAKAFGKFSISDKKRKKFVPSFPVESRGRGDADSENREDDNAVPSGKFSSERFDKRARQESPYSSSSPDKLSQREKEKRAKRFGGGDNGITPLTRSFPALDIDGDQPLIGRCMSLEKKYFRLTAAPDPDNVRPLHVLEKTLELLKKKWREEQNYSYICDQFKSLRQDLTVQHIKSNFTVLVYEIHARIALEKVSCIHTDVSDRR
jgi:hypothetical protein